jgi:branched-chain amino acid transport system substrate-binding protein
MCLRLVGEDFFEDRWLKLGMMVELFGMVTLVSAAALWGRTAYLKKFIPLTAAFFCLFGCGDGDIGKRRLVKYNTSKSNEITIGVVDPVASTQNTHYIKGVEFAVNTINNSGGILNKRLNIVIRDDKNDPNFAMQVAQTFSNKGITAVVGHWSTNTTYYAQDIYENNRMVMLTPSATGLILFEEQFDYIFRIIGSNQVFVRAIALEMAKRNYENVAICFSEDDYGIDLAKVTEKELNAVGIRVVDRTIGINPLNADQILNRWSAFGCDAIIMAASYPEFLGSIKTIRQNNLWLPIFSSENFLDISPTDLPDEYFDSLYFSTLDPKDVDTVFLKNFNSEYGHNPDIYAINAYEAVMLLKDAMEAAHTIDATAIAEYLSNLKDYKTVSGVRTYNPETQEFDGYNTHIQPLRSVILKSAHDRK